MVIHVFRICHCQPLSWAYNREGGEQSPAPHKLSTRRERAAEGAVSGQRGRGCDVKNEAGEDLLRGEDKRPRRRHGLQKLQMRQASDAAPSKAHRASLPGRAIFNPTRLASPVPTASAAHSSVPLTTHCGSDPCLWGRVVVMGAEEGVGYSCISLCKRPSCPT